MGSGRPVRVRPLLDARARIHLGPPFLVQVRVELPGRGDRRARGQDVHDDHVAEPELAVVGHQAQQVVARLVEGGHGAGRSDVVERHAARALRALPRRSPAVCPRVGRRRSRCPTGGRCSWSVRMSAPASTTGGRLKGIARSSSSTVAYGVLSRSVQDVSAGASLTKNSTPGSVT